MARAPTVDGDPGGGGGGTPGTGKLEYLYLTWAWPANIANPNGGFEVIFFTGTDPTVSDTYLCLPIQCPPTDRHCQQPLSLSVNLTNVNAAVRAVYA